MRYHEITETETHVWTSENAKRFRDQLSRIAKPYDISFEIVGGVRSRGFSNHDLDLKVVYGDDEDFDELLNHLKTIGYEIDVFSSQRLVIMEIPDGRSVDLFT